MADARRVEMDWEAYQRLVRRACFVCELLAGNPDYPHQVVYRDGATVAFPQSLPVVAGPPARRASDARRGRRGCGRERGYLDVPDQAQADLATRLRIRMTLDPAAGR